MFPQTFRINGDCILEYWLLSLLRQLFLSPASKAKPVKIKKGALKLSALEMLENKNERKADFKELELEQRKKEFEFEKQKYEEAAAAAERLEKLRLEIEEKRAFLALLKVRL